jgi:hypothetical protein
MPYYSQFLKRIISRKTILTFIFKPCFITEKRTRLYVLLI